MNMKRIFCILFLLFATVGSGMAQTGSTAQQAGEQRVFSTDVFGVGLAASLCSGMGLSFKHHPGNVPFAYQVTGGVWKQDSLSMYDIGAEFQYDLSVDNNRLYAVAGAGYYHVRSGSEDLNDPTRLGIGVGYEVPLSPRFGASFNLMITLFQPSGTILPLPSVGIHTYFK
jgi:hypothetical protein